MRNGILSPVLCEFTKKLLEKSIFDIINRLYLKEDTILLIF